MAERRLGCWVVILLGGGAALACACGGVVAWQGWGEPAVGAWAEARRWTEAEEDVATWVGDPPRVTTLLPGVEVVDPDTVRLTVTVTGPTTTGGLDLELHRIDGEWRVATAMRQGPDGPYPLEEEPSVLARDDAEDPAAAASIVAGARAHADQKRWGETEELADRALALVPEHPEALALRGLARVMTDQLELGADDLRRAVQLDPTPADPWASLGWVEARLGNDDAAIKAWNQRIRRAPEDGRARAERADARFRAGDRPGALEDAGESCRLGYGPGCSLEQRIASTGR